MSFDTLNPADQRPTTPVTRPAIPNFRPFPVDALPEPFARFVIQAGDAIGCDTSYVALPLLAGAASAIGTTHQIQAKPGWVEPSILWVASIGESGAIKSPPLDLALAAIRKRQHESMKRHAVEMDAFRQSLAEVGKDVGARPEPPVAARCLTSDTTTEALAPLLQQNPRGLLMVRDELSGWFAFDQYKSGRGGDAARWLEAYGGRSWIVDRKGGGTIYVPRVAVSIAGSIQPDTLRRALGQEHRDNGLAPRILMASPPREKRVWSEAEVSPATVAEVDAVFAGLFNLTMEDDPTSSALHPDTRPRTLTLAPRAKAAFIRFFKEHAEEQATLSGDLLAVWSKHEGACLRLALVIHLVRRAAGDETLADPQSVDEASIASAVKIIRWFGQEARRLYAIMDESDVDRDQRRLVELIHRIGGEATSRELMRKGPCFKTLALADAALEGLEKAGLGVWEAVPPGPKGGKPFRRFRLTNPPALSTKPLPRSRNGVPSVVSDRQGTAGNGGDWGTA